MLDSPPSAQRGDPSPLTIPPINKPLSFVLSHDPENLVRRFITSFIPSWRHARFIGGLEGWPVILINGRDLFLLNKAFNSIIPLPPLPDRCPEPAKTVLSSPPLSPSPSCECTVVIKRGSLYYCRLGFDNRFSKLVDDLIYDFLFYKEQLYVLCFSNTIIIFDHLLNKITQLVAHFGDSWVFGLYRLLISENKLLMITASFTLSGVFKFEPQSESRVIRVENICENLLLINRSCSLSITTKEHTEFRRTDNLFGNGSRTGTIILDRSEDSNKAKVDDPWPLFFVMFKDDAIKNLGVKRTIM